MQEVNYGQVCDECGKDLIRTSEMYWSCPDAHGRLHFVNHGNPRKAAREISGMASRFSKALKVWTKWLERTTA